MLTERQILASSELLEKLSMEGDEVVGIKKCLFPLPSISVWTAVRELFVVHFCILSIVTKGRIELIVR